MINKMLPKNVSALAVLLTLGACGGGGSSPSAPTLEQLAAIWVPPGEQVSAQALTGTIIEAYLGADGFMVMNEDLPSQPEDPVNSIRSRSYFGFITVNNGAISGELNYIEMVPGEESTVGIVPISGLAADATSLSAVIDFADNTTFSFALERGDELDPPALDPRLTGQWSNQFSGLPDDPLDLMVDAEGNGVGLFQQVCAVTATFTPLDELRAATEERGALILHRFDFDATGGCEFEGSYYGTAVVLQLSAFSPPLLVLPLRIGNAERTFEAGLLNRAPFP